MSPTITTYRARAAWVLPVALWALVVGPAAARAQAGGDAAAELARGIELYNDLEYEAAIPVLEQAAADSSLPRPGRIEGYKLLALSHLALGQTENARRAFRGLLALDPSYELPAAEGQKAVALFTEVKRSLPVVAPAPIPLVVTPPAPPADDPFTRMVAAPAAQPVPITRRWWFWAGTAAVVIGGGVALWAMSGGGEPATDATVVITVE
jgi:tetratricopeptide (TPR) repeat protein